MSDLEFWTAASALWIAVAWVPYVLDRMAVRGVMGAMANPSPELAPQSAWAERAKSAHKVSVEMFVAFAPLAAIAMMRLPVDTYAGTLAMCFFIGTFSHYVVYALGIVVVRTLAFVLASLSTVALGLRVFGVI